MATSRYFVFLSVTTLFLISCSSGGSTGNPTGDSDAAESTDQSENEISQEDEETSQGLLSASPSEIRFGAVVLGDTSTETLTLTNDGKEDLTISVVRINEATTPEFSVQTMLQGDQAIEVPVVLVPGQNLAINLQYAPVDAGSDTGTLQIIGDDFQNNLLEVSLFADEKGESGLDVTPRLEFGYAGNIGEEETQSLTIWNLPEDPQSNRTLQVTKLEIAEGTRDFHLDLDSCAASSQHPILIAPGKSHSCSVVFSPREAGELFGAIHIETNASEGEASGDVNLSGRCAPPETVLTLVVNPRGEPVPGAELRLWGEDAVLATTDSRGRAVILPEDGGQIFAADGATSVKGVYSRQYKQVLPEDEVSVFVVDLLPVETSQPVSLGQVSASNLDGALLAFSENDVQLPNGTGTTLYMGEGHPSAAPYDLPAGKELVQMFHFGPDGTTFTNPAKLTLPNSLELAPGEQIEFHSFDESTLLWEKAAVLEVNADGTLLETIEGGLTHFSAGGIIQPEGSLPEYTVTGLVQDDFEQNLSDIHVFAMGARGRMLDDTTNDQGSYTISGIRVSCHKSPYLTVAASRNGTFLDDTLTSVVAEVTDDPSQTVHAPVLVLPNNVAKGSVRGKALSPLGTPVVNARVTVYPALGWDLIDQTDAQGRFVVSAVPAGAARVEIEHDDLRLYKEVSGEIPENGEWNLGEIILDEAADTEPPRVLWSKPAGGQKNLSNLSELVVVFNEKLDPTSVNATLKRSLTNETISGSAPLENGTTVVFTPDVSFEDGRVYSFTLGAGLADLSGNTLGEELVLHFQTVAPSCPDAECKSGIFIWGTESCGYEPLVNGTSCRNDHGSCNGNGECVCNNEFMTEDCSACMEGYIGFPNCEEDVCIPNCDGKLCGDNGCGNDCGECGSCEICDQSLGMCRLSLLSSIVPAVSDEFNVNCDNITATEDVVYSVVGYALEYGGFCGKVFRFDRRADGTLADPVFEAEPSQHGTWAIIGGNYLYLLGSDSASCCNMDISHVAPIQNNGEVGDFTQIVDLPYASNDYAGGNAKWGYVRGGRLYVQSTGGETCCWRERPPTAVISAPINGDGTLGAWRFEYGATWQDEQELWLFAIRNNYAYLLFVNPDNFNYTMYRAGFENGGLISATHEGVDVSALDFLHQRHNPGGNRYDFAYTEEMIYAYPREYTGSQCSGNETWTRLYGLKFSENGLSLRLIALSEPFVRSDICPDRLAANGRDVYISRFPIFFARLPEGCFP